MRSRALLFGLLLPVSLIAACARVKVMKLETSNSQMKGVRYYRPWPYLATFRDESGACVDTIVYLPDPEEQYVVQAKAGFGSSEAKITLENGWNLVGYGSITDSKIPETITALTGLLGAVKSVSPGLAATPTPTPCPVGLRKLQYSKSTGWH